MTTEEITLDDDNDDVALYNNFASAAVDLSSAHVSQNNEILTFVRSVRDIDTNQRRRYLYSYLISSSSSSPIALGMPTELNDNIKMRIPSPSGNKIMILREEEELDTKKKLQVLEVWDNTSDAGLQKRILLPSPKLHGKVIADAASFGYPSWDPTKEEHIVYAAERKAPETTGFFDTSDDDDKKSFVGGKHQLGVGKMESWGEKYSQQSALLDLFLVNLSTGKVGKITNVPGADDDSTTTTEGGYTLGQPIFTPDGTSIVYIGWDAGAGPDMPKRLGFIYCQQRPSKVFSSPVGNLLLQLSSSTNTTQEKDAEFQCLTPDFCQAVSPRFGPSKLVFLASKKGFDSHFGNLALYGMDWKEDGSLDLSSEQVIVDHIWNPNYSDSNDDRVDGIPFPGLFMLQLPTNCFVSPDQVLATTFWGSTTKIVQISLSNKTCKLLKANLSDKSLTSSSQQLLCVAPKNGGAVVVESSPNQPGIVGHVELLQNDNKSTIIAKLSSVASSKYSTPIGIEQKDISYQVINIEIPDKEEEETMVDHQTPLQCVLLLPTKLKQKNKDESSSIPLIVVPHGGPHSAYTTNYVPSWSYLVGCGYAVLQVNFRGSIGFGQAYVETLFSHIGSKDVKDVVTATKYVMDQKEFPIDSGSTVNFHDASKIGICGGSHGGFLAAHCTSQYPSLFKAAVMRNPVTNIASMVTTTDIPDWCHVEGLGKYNYQQYAGPTQDELVGMYQKSPVALAKEVTAPTLVALGLKDLRVPPSQGMEWYHTLRSTGKAKCKLLLYENCDHAIDEVASEADHWINIKRWFDEHLLKRKSR